MSTISDPKSHEGINSGPILRITRAAAALRIAKEGRKVDARVAAEDQLHQAVLAARDLGVSWQRIGETLGVARGNAYQRFRHRPGEDMTHRVSRSGPGLGNG